MKKKTSKAEVQELYSKHNGNYSKIAQECGVSRQRVAQILGPMGLAGFGKKALELTADTQDQIKQRIAEGKTLSDLSEEFNVGTDTISSYIKKNNLPKPARKLIGSKTSKEEVLEMYAKHDGNYSKMAEDMGTFASHIYRLVKRYKLDIKSKASNVSKNFSEDVVREAYESVNGDIKRASTKLNVSQPTMVRYLKKFNIVEKEA